MLLSLQKRLPPGRIVTDPDIGARYWRDQGAWAQVGEPRAVVKATSTAEVQEIVRWCIETGTPLVPRGAGTGLSGGANAIDQGVVLVLEGMDQILHIDAAERFAVVQPGVINDELRAAVAEHGLWYPPDPASSPWSTLGGNVATNAGGLCCLKYGVTGDYVLGMTIVDGHGDIVEIGRRTRKGVTGYDLVALLTGSEGTLGVITEITVRLRPARPAETTVAGYFDSVEAAGHAVAAVARSSITPSALELVDQHCLRAVDAWKQMGLSADAEVVLLGRSDAGVDAAREAAVMVQCFEEAGATLAVASEDEQESEALFQARRLAYPALERLGQVLTEDVCVPMMRVPDMLGFIHQTSERHQVQIANIAHAGDGNLHPLIILPQDDQQALARADVAFREIMREAIRLGGTVSGEHGIGTIKLDSYAEEVSATQLRMLTAIKQALDPHQILNPGKALPQAGRVDLPQ